MARRMFYTFWNVFSNIHLWFVSFSAHLDEHSLRANCGIFFKPRFFWLDRLVSLQKNSPYRSMKKGDGWKQNFSFLLRINLEICLIFAIHLLEDMDTLCAFEKILFLLPKIACSVYALPTHTHAGIQGHGLPTYMLIGLSPGTVPPAVSLLAVFLK